MRVICSVVPGGWIFRGRYVLERVTLIPVGFWGSGAPSQILWVSLEQGQCGKTPWRLPMCPPYHPQVSKKWWPAVRTASHLGVDCPWLNLLVSCVHTLSWDQSKWGLVLTSREAVHLRWTLWVLAGSPAGQWFLRILIWQLAYETRIILNKELVWYARRRNWVPFPETIWKRQVWWLLLVILEQGEVGTG